ncbi:UNVERIFIED_CONTAM: histone lysine acetyltransferase MYST-A [Hammondia hammondi]|eukprot:XP_008885265.1 histone lysine acetyltransferase MYST-A [Hammondia hammondi]
MKRVSSAAAPRLSAGAPSAVRPPQPAISKGASAASGKGAVKAGAGLCKGKRGGKTISTAKMSDSYVVSFPNALPVKQVIWARDSLAGAWRLCSIVHARVRVAPPVNGSSSSSSEGREGSKPSPDNYDYYVHFLGFDRRLDQWKAWEEVRENESDLPRDEPCVKEVPDSSDDEHAGMDEEYLREHEEATKVKSIGTIRMGRYSVDTWYFSPYPKLFQNVQTLHICEFCLTFFREETELRRHTGLCECRHPPGNEIYRDKDIAMFEVDGNHCRVYCENLCFLSKLFLDHKTLRHPVSLFLFYVMTEIDDKGYHITGYFSKEKYSKNNVSCILTLPQHQRKGYGKFLINFSYALSRAERKAGTPERPLSDLGKASYIAFWTEAILALLERNEGRISVQDLSRMTCIEQADILACLEHHGVLKSKGECFFLVLPQQKIKALKEAAGRPSRAVKAEELHWIPYDRYLMPFEYSPQA